MGHLTHDRWMGSALALGERGRGRTGPNPNVGCVIVAGGRVVGRGWTQAGGRPHAEAMALAQARVAARGATLYTSLEPCAHLSTRGPACTDLIIASGVTRVVAAMEDPDARTAGRGFARLIEAGVNVERDVRTDDARRSMAGFLTRQAHGRPFVTLKLATSLDGCIATAAGESRWITGPIARAHAHLERSRHEAILVGRGTWDADAPALDVRLPGLGDRAPRRIILSSCVTPALSRGPASSPPVEQASGTPGQARGDDDCAWITSPAAIATLPANHLLVEGGAVTAAAFLRADLVDRLLLYRAPILLGGGPTLGAFGLVSLAQAHGRWRMTDARALGSDRLEVYERG
ncbi:MAG TPA: bifunctional diaminohydroxyphosphoribosylaminopyrimidine deaminase/5-amino-6-(5-phosphoribosylamino)uracil reductase RibD [Sphingomonas sp.]